MSWVSINRSSRKEEIFTVFVRLIVIQPFLKRVRTNLCEFVGADFLFGHEDVREVTLLRLCNISTEK